MNTAGLPTPKFSIGIDLGTTNCAMAYSELKEFAVSQVFSIPQQESFGTATDATTLPSFLFCDDRAPANQWIPGRFARKQAAEASGRVVHSAKSWLCHHAVDREANFLPWRSDELPVEARISPIQASALLLSHLRTSWNLQFGQKFPFNAQNVTITVPASFDAAAQRLTLEAARQAGYPESVRLLEEPQAAFYRWLESHALESLTSLGSGHLLVIDIGGGTTDLSLFELRPGNEQAAPEVKRVAVSDHLLLGGDNIDLALAHLAEPRLAREALSAAQWNYLVARCRDLKERCLAEEAPEFFPLSVPGRGSGLFAGVLTAKLSRQEVEDLVFEGFYPECEATDRPKRTQAGLREWALPYASDSGITRYVAEFLQDRPKIEAILFNGGSLTPARLRRRLRQLVTRWQGGQEPQILENDEPELAVARGAARFGQLLHLKAARIEAGAPRSIYLEVQRPGAEPALVCVLPAGARSEEEFELGELGLELRLNRPVRFQPLSSTRRTRDLPGAVVHPNEDDFSRLPALRTIATVPGRRIEADSVPVHLISKMNELGLLQIACKSADPTIRQSWPLDFDLRPFESEIGTAKEEADPGVDRAELTTAQERLRAAFSRDLNPRDKLGATSLFKQLESALKKNKAEWNGALLRALARTLLECFEQQSKSIEHAETWRIVAGYLLRPGFGMPGDELRIDSLWRLRTERQPFPGKRIQVQDCILWRRVAGGLSFERQTALIEPELPVLRSGKSVSPELIRLVGALEHLSEPLKTELVSLFLERALQHAMKNEFCAHYLTALGLLLNRAPLYAPSEAVLPPEFVENAFAELASLDWKRPDLLEIQPLFLRAARLVENPELNLAKGVRAKIASKLESAGVAPSKAERLRSYAPMERSDRSGLFGESLPSGLLMGKS